MIKKISFMVSMLFFLLGTNVFAHSHLEDSSPKNGEVVTQELKDITLTFETKLEQTSSFSLKNQNGTEIPLTQVTVDGNKLVGTPTDKLENGGYTVHWKIIGIDGHLLEGDIPFTVQLPEVQKAAASTEGASTEQASTEKADKTADTAAKEQKAKSAAVMAKNVETDQPTFKNYVIPASVGLLIVVGAGSYWLLYRRKRA